MFKKSSDEMNQTYAAASFWDSNINPDTRGRLEKLAKMGTKSMAGLAGVGGAAAGYLTSDEKSTQGQRLGRALGGAALGVGGVYGMKKFRGKKKGPKPKSVEEVLENPAVTAEEKEALRKILERMNKTASYAKYTAGGAIAGGLAGLGASAAKGQGTKKRKKSALVGAALGAAGGAGAYRLRKIPTQEQLLQKLELSYGDTKAGRRIVKKLDKAEETAKFKKLMAEEKRLKGILKERLLTRAELDALDKLVVDADKMYAKALAKPGARSGFAAAAGLGGAAGYGMHDKNASAAKASLLGAAGMGAYGAVSGYNAHKRKPGQRYSKAEFQSMKRQKMLDEQSKAGIKVTVLDRKLNDMEVQEAQLGRSHMAKAVARRAAVGAITGAAAGYLGSRAAR
jgi:hypothetical protein